MKKKKIKIFTKKSKKIFKFKIFHILGIFGLAIIITVIALVFTTYKKSLANNQQFLYCISCTLNSCLKKQINNCTKVGDTIGYYSTCSGNHIACFKPFRLVPSPTPTPVLKITCRSKGGYCIPQNVCRNNCGSCSKYNCGVGSLCCL